MESAFLLLFATSALSATYYVSPTGSDSNPGTEPAPFRNIQKAADIVNPGDTVIAKDGTYADTNRDGVIVHSGRGGTSDKWVTFKAENKWGAVLDGQNNATGYGWNFMTGGSYIRIEGFEIKGTVYGGVWSNEAAHHLYFYRNHIHHIGVRYYAGQLGQSGVFQGTNADYHTYDSNVIHTIGRTGVPSDLLNHDHAFYVCGNYTDIINNVIYDIYAGWGIQLSGAYGKGDYYNIINNTFADQNFARDGQIIFWGASHDIVIQNNIFYEPRNSAIYIYAACSDLWNITVRNNITSVANFFVDPAYNPTPGCPGWTVSDNSTRTDPLFFNAGTRNYTLLEGSPAIDAGLATNLSSADHLGNTRPWGNGYDIGAYEYTSDSSDTIPPTTPTSLTVSAVSSSQINLSWDPSTDDTGVTGYKIYRDNAYLANTANTSYQNIGLQPSTTYTYKVSAFDGAGNESGQSASISAKTQPGSLANSSTIIANSDNFAGDHPVEQFWDGCTEDRAECCSGAGNIASFWVEFDFGQNYDLTSARLFGDADGDWVSTAWQLQYKLNAGDTWKTAFSDVNALLNGWITQELDVTARYVRVEVFGNAAIPATQARELEIYGTPSASQQAPESPRTLRIFIP